VLSSQDEFLQTLHIHLRVFAIVFVLLIDITISYIDSELQETLCFALLTPVIASF